MVSFRYSGSPGPTQAVLTDANGTPTGIQLYNPWGFEVTIHNPSLIYYCSRGIGTFEVN
jgi:hypothetical protein